MHIQIKKWKKDNDTQLVKKYTIYRNIFYGLSLAFILGSLFSISCKKVKKYPGRYSYRFDPEDEDTVLYSTQEEEEQEYESLKFDSEIITKAKEQEQESIIPAINSNINNEIIPLVIDKSIIIDRKSVV